MANKNGKCRLAKLFTFDIRSTSMISGKSFKLLVISTIMTQRETVILIEPPRKEAAPNRAYLENPISRQNTLTITQKKKKKEPTKRYAVVEGKTCSTTSDSYFLTTSLFLFSLFLSTS